MPFVGGAAAADKAALLYNNQGSDRPAVLICAGALNGLVSTGEDRFNQNLSAVIRR